MSFVYFTVSAGRTAVACICLLLATIQLAAQNAEPDEAARLMQEYMALRAEWVELRRDALERASRAPNETARRQIREKLAEDEQPLVARMNDAARAYREAERQKREKRMPPPRT